MRKLFAIIPFWLLIFTSCMKSKDDLPPPVHPPTGSQSVFPWSAIADSAQLSLNQFWIPGGRYFSMVNGGQSWVNYWPSAHALDVLVDLYTRKPSAQLKSRMEDVLWGIRAQNGNNFINYYYDDMEWLALACIRAFDVTKDDLYRNVADTLWTDIKKGWSNDLGGGIWWRKDNSSKNAPSNLPAAILAARLYKRFGKTEDLDWANRIYSWQKSNLYEPSSGWVLDNIDKNGVKNTSWRFTYNQGTMTGAALELFNATGNTSFLADAVKSADYAVNSGLLTDVSNNILKDEGNGDGGLFKGVFVRYFTRLIVEGNLDPSKQKQYIAFLKNNAQTLWRSGTNKTLVLFGSAWNRVPQGNVELTTQLSGIMLLESMAELKNRSLTD